MLSLIHGDVLGCICTTLYSYNPKVFRAVKSWTVLIFMIALAISFLWITMLIVINVFRDRRQTCLIRVRFLIQYYSVCVYEDEQLTGDDDKLKSNELYVIYHPTPFLVTSKSFNSFVLPIRNMFVYSYGWMAIWICLWRGSSKYSVVFNNVLRPNDNAFKRIC